MALLGDLFPAEWPPHGIKRTGQPHPAPPDVSFRSMLARSFEKSTDLWRRLIYFGLETDSRIIRAILVRMCARAAGAPTKRSPPCVHNVYQS